MAAMWTHGTWTVRPGREDDFIRTWTDMARRGRAELEPAAPPTLLRGALESLQPDILEAFEPRVLDEVEQDG